MQPAPPYIERAIDGVLDELMAELPAIQLVGPRAVGKTTTARRRVASVVHLDRPGQAIAFRADPDAALAALDEPVLLDEWQAVPEVLPAVKRAVDVDPRPGRFLITGSVRARLDAPTWAGTGRVVNLTMRPLVERELIGRATASSFFDRVVSGDVGHLVPGAPDLVGYLELAVRGGFPGVVALGDGAGRRRWQRGYLAEVVHRDAELVDGGRDPDRLARYLSALAANTAGVVDDKRLYDAAGITRVTAVAYEQLLRNLHVLDVVPAWSDDRVQRLVSRPKRYLVDSGLVAAELRADVQDVLLDGDLLGRLLDTFVAAQLRVEAEVARREAQLFHLRDANGRREVDLLADVGARGVVGIEVKATAAPTASMAKHLRWLRDQLGDRFVRGVLLHTGPAAFELDDRILALPIAAIWT